MKAEEFFREVEEELRQERMLGLWRRFGPYVIGLAVAIVLATAAKVGYESWRDKRMQAQAEAFRAAETLLARDPAAAAAAFRELAGWADEGVAGLARLMAAAALREAGRRDEARAVLAGNAGLDDPALAAYAALLAVQYGIDGDDPAALARRLTPLTADDAAFRHSARELAALVALRRGDRGEARRLLERLRDDATAPETLRRRARELLESLGPTTDGAGPSS